MTGTLTRVDEKVAAFNKQVEKLKQVKIILAEF